MNWFDTFFEKTSRTAARLTSRRSFVAGVGVVLASAGAFPLLPVSRVRGEEIANDPGDPENCDYWRYCAIDGYLCSCCGGTHTACPPGTIRSPITWVGTCLNPGDPLNKIFYHIFNLESILLKNKIPLPFGVSILLSWKKA